ncbi:MAG: hypothetical protein EBU90_21950 [Proteobacteria bacterium]|nr:hypothetical protein [Pseudomonadota bacterium]NBP16004.1 hypothetical protein [bacterium]
MIEFFSDVRYLQGLNCEIRQVLAIEIVRGLGNRRNNSRNAGKDSQELLGLQFGFLENYVVVLWCQQFQEKAFQFFFETR